MAERAGFLLGERNELLERLGGNPGMHDDDLVAHGKYDDGLQVSFDVERQIVKTRIRGELGVERQ